MLSRQGRARIIVAGAAAVVAAVFAAAPAHAQVLSWTVSPGGAASASTGTVLSDNGIDISCTDSSADASLNTAATGSPAVLGSTTPSFTNCTGPLGPLTVTVNGAPYNIDGVSFDAAAGLTGQGQAYGFIDGVNVHLTMTSCSFDVTGAAPGYFDNEDSTLNLTPSATSLAGGAQLTVSNVVGCFGVVNNGDHPGYTSSYNVSPRQTITATGS